MKRFLTAALTFIATPLQRAGAYDVGVRQTAVCGPSTALAAQALGSVGLALAVLAGFAQSASAQTVSAQTVSGQSAPSVVTTIAQIGQPLRQISGDCLQVTSLLGPGSDPHLYRPTRSDMAGLLQADILVHNGAHLEAQFAQPLAQFTKRKPVFALASYVPMAGLMHDGEQVTDPHFWMSPALWGFLLTRLVEDMLADARVAGALAPGCAQAMQAASLAYQAQLEALDAWTQAIFAKLPEERRLLVTAHDAFGYFGQRYAFQVEGIQGLSTDSQASLKRMNDLANLLVTRDIPVAFVESSIDPKSIQSLLSRTAALGGSVALGEPLFSDAMGAAGSPEAQYLGMFAHNVRAMARGFDLQTPLLNLDVLAPDFAAQLTAQVAMSCGEAAQGNQNGDSAC